jgi:plasmid stabilization system protein ParE
MAERYHVIIEPRASRDLISIYEYIEKNFSAERQFYCASDF